MFHPALALLLLTASALTVSGLNLPPSPRPPQKPRLLIGAEGPLEPPSPPHTPPHPPRHLVGVAVPADVHSTEIRSAAHHGVALLSKQTIATLKGLGLTGPLSVSHVTKATAQPVSGILYQMTVSVKGAHDHHVLLHMSVIYRSWLPVVWTLTSFSA